MSENTKDALVKAYIARVAAELDIPLDEDGDLAIIYEFCQSDIEDAFLAGESSAAARIRDLEAQLATVRAEVEAEVVAWLRNHADKDSPYNLAVGLHHAARAIARGDHRPAAQKEGG